jgi:hypothetical protein
MLILLLGANAKVYHGEKTPASPLTRDKVETKAEVLSWWDRKWMRDRVRADD